MTEGHPSPAAPTRPRASIPLSARATLTVDLAALRANWARLNQASGRAECAGVIKADVTRFADLADAGRLPERI